MSNPAFKMDLQISPTRASVNLVFAVEMFIIILRRSFEL